MDDTERRLLRALALMCEQYIGSGNADWLDHQCISAGEDAVELLIDYGFVEPWPDGRRGGLWTESGKAFLASI
ncbi:MAG: hypothetical protein JSR45_13235 [Proteobacteria bacterium]|nr:hypothetical protein [Pseudomonadota bacterium]